MRRGGSVVRFFSNPKELFQKLEVIIGSILAGNTNVGIKNTGVGILDLLLKEGAINRSQHEKLFRKYFKPKMEEREIVLSSFSVKTGGNKPENFTTQFRQPIFLDPNSQYVVGLNRIINMSFTWYNINAALKNQLIKFSSDGGETFSDITFPAGVWDYSSLNEAIQNATGPLTEQNKKFPINLLFLSQPSELQSRWKKTGNLISLHPNFGNLIGFDKRF